MYDDFKVQSVATLPRRRNNTYGGWSQALVLVCTIKKKRLDGERNPFHMATGRQSFCNALGANKCQNLTCQIVTRIVTIRGEYIGRWTMHHRAPGGVIGPPDPMLLQVPLAKWQHGQKGQ